MSRALNIDATADHITARCAKHGLSISAIEPLRSGGTRVVMNNMADVETISQAYGKKVIAGPVQREPTRLNRL